MRKLRVERLENGEAISTAPKANTVRSISRVRVIQDQDDEIVLRCAQNLREFRKENLKHYTADITYHLTRDADTGFKINRKIINLVNSTDTLAGISYILWSGNMKQVVLVTGAASGLGNVIAEYFASQGHQVILSASTPEKSRKC